MAAGTSKACNILLLCIAMAMATGCGEEEIAEEADDVGEQIYGSADVQGVFRGKAIHLRYASLIPGETFDTLCVSNKRIEDRTCHYHDEKERYLLYANVLRGQRDVRWAFPQVEMRRTGKRPRIQLTTSGSIRANTRNSGFIFSLTFDGEELAGSVSF